MQKNNSYKIFTGSILVLLFYCSLTYTAHASYLKLITPINEEIIDASQPYFLKGEQEGVSKWSIDFEHIKDPETCHNNGTIFYHLPQDRNPVVFTIQSTTTSFEEKLDFSTFSNKLSEKMSYIMKIKNGYNGTSFDQRIIKFKNIPGLDWCDNPEFAFWEFSNAVTIGSVSARAESYLLNSNVGFGFRMTGVENIVMDYGDGTIKEFPAKGIYGGGSYNLFPHTYQKPGDYTVVAKVFNFKGDVIEKSTSFKIVDLTSKPILPQVEKTENVKVVEYVSNQKVVPLETTKTEIEKVVVTPITTPTPPVIQPVIVKNFPKIVPKKEISKNPQQRETKESVVTIKKDEVSSVTSTSSIEQNYPPELHPTVKVENKTFFQSIIFNLKKIFNFW